MECYTCKEDIDQLWALCSHGRAYCSSTCFERRTDASSGSSTHAPSRTDRQAVSAISVHVEVQQGHQRELFDE